jgi:hypothetical protein
MSVSSSRRLEARRGKYSRLPRTNISILAEAIVAGFGSGLWQRKLTNARVRRRWDIRGSIRDRRPVAEGVLYGDRQLELAIRARKTPLGFSSAQIAPLVLEMSRQTAKARSRVARRSSAVAFSGWLRCKHRRSAQGGVWERNADHAASTAFQISGAVLSLMRSFPSLN